MSQTSRTPTDDPYLDRVRQICLALPAAAEKLSHGHPTFFTKKSFCVYGGVLPKIHWSPEYARAIMFLPPADERAALLADPRSFVPAYFGPAGWLGLNFASGEPDWDEVAEVIMDSYRMTAPKRLIAQLDESLSE